MEPIVSVRQFARKVGAPVDRLEEIASDPRAHYRSWWKWNPKKQQSREIKAPDLELKQILRRLKKNVLQPLAISDAAHGGVKDRSTCSNAKLHLAQPCVITLDAKKFFESITHLRVYHMLRAERGFGRDVARLITRLTTLDGSLPQGAPTSTVIANLVVSRAVDIPLSEAARKMDVKYSRYVDDIALSGQNPRPFINLAAQLLSRRGLQMHRKRAKFFKQPKLKIMSRSQPQEVTGLTVNSGRLSISRQRRDAVRSAILQLAQMAQGEARRKAEESLRGRVNHIRRFNPGSAKRLDAYLETMRRKCGSSCCHRPSQVPKLPSP